MSFEELDEYMSLQNEFRRDEYKSILEFFMGVSKSFEEMSAWVCKMSFEEMSTFNST